MGALEVGAMETLRKGEVLVRKSDGRVYKVKAKNDGWVVLESQARDSASHILAWDEVVREDFEKVPWKTKQAR